MQAAWQLQGGRMLFWDLAPAGVGDDCEWNAGADGAGGHLTTKTGKTYEDYLGLRGLERMGKKNGVCTCENREETKGCPGSRLRGAGWGNSKKLKKPPAARGWEQLKMLPRGFRMWEK